MEKHVSKKYMVDSIILHDFNVLGEAIVRKKRQVSHSVYCDEPSRRLHVHVAQL